jgi:hypothetical protein
VHVHGAARRDVRQEVGLAAADRDAEVDRLRTKRRQHTGERQGKRIWDFVNGLFVHLTRRRAGNRAHGYVSHVTSPSRGARLRRDVGLLVSRRRPRNKRAQRLANRRSTQARWGRARESRLARAHREPREGSREACSARWRKSAPGRMLLPACFAPAKQGLLLQF